MIDKDAGDAPFQIAAVYALRNDAAQTFAWLDRAWSNRDPGVQGLLYDPFILRFKDDPRFCRLLPQGRAAPTGRDAREQADLTGADPDAGRFPL